MAKLNLTAKTIDALKPKNKRADYFDTNLAGFCLRVTENGIKTFSVMYRFAGRLRRYTLGVYPTMTLAEARENAKEAQRTASRGTDPAAIKKQERQADTFEELTTAYMERWAKKQKKSWPDDQRMIDVHLLPRFKNIRASALTRADVRAALELIAEDAPISANRVLALLRKVYNWGISQDLVPANPCAQIPRPSPEKQRDRVLSESEIKKVWQAFDEERPLMAALFKLRLLTAARGGEVESMRWSDITKEGEETWWTIPSEKSKNALPHRVPLSAPAVRILEALRKRQDEQKKAANKNSPFVFYSARNGEHINSVQKAVQSIRGEPDTKDFIDFVAHDLRRTAASFMTSMGIPRLVVGRILNHSETGVTAVYDRHSYDKEKREALEAWGSRLMVIVSDLKEVKQKSKA